MNLELYLEQMKELVNIDSGSENVAGINRVADKLAGWYQEIGWNVERIPVDGGRQVLLITNHVSEHYDAMYIGHMDTVFPDGTAEKRPFRIRKGNFVSIRADKCYNIILRSCGPKSDAGLPGGMLLTLGPQKI